MDKSHFCNPKYVYVVFLISFSPILNQLILMLLWRVQGFLRVISMLKSPWITRNRTQGSLMFKFVLSFLWVFTCTQAFFKKKKKDGFPGGSGDKNPPANARDTNSIPEAGRSHLPRSNQVHAPQLLSLCSRGRKPKLLNPQDAPSEKSVRSTAHAPEHEKPLQREAGNRN